MLRSRVEKLEKEVETLKFNEKHWSGRFFDLERKFYALMKHLEVKVEITPAICPKMKIVSIKKKQKYSRAKELMSKIHKCKCKRDCCSNCDCSCKECEHCK